MKITITMLMAVLLIACASKNPPENTTAADYNIQLGLGYLEKGDNVRAKEKLLRATTQAPDLIDTHLALAYYYEQMGQIPLADQSYQQALNIAPKSGRVNNNYGAFLCKQQDYASALQYLEKAINDPYYHQTAKAYENAALCSIELHNPSITAHYANLAVQQDPSKQDVYLKLSYLLEQQGEKDEAEHYLKRYHQANS